MLGRMGISAKGLVGAKTVKAATFFLVTAILLFYIAHYTLAEGGKGQSVSRASETPPEVAVVVIQPERVTLTTELPGRTSAYLVAEVRPQVSGIIQKRLFNEGADVKAGDTLYQIDPALFQSAVDIASANLAAARKAAEQARAAVVASLANVKQRQATWDLAKADRRRFEALAKDGAVSISDRDKAVTNDQVSEAGLRTAEAQAKSDQEAVAGAEAAIHQAEAALKTAQINLGYTKITAPISGRIGKSNVTVGALVTAQQPLALATIQQLNPIYVDSPQSSANMLRLKRNQAAGRIKGTGPEQAQVKLLLEDGMPYPVEGSLKFSDVTVEPSTGSFIFRMIFPNPEQLLLPGMYVRAVLKEGVVESAILLPQQGVLRDRKGNPFALIVDAAGKVQECSLKLDRAIGDKWLVTSGLKPGDRVVVEGSQKAKPGASVKAVPFQSPQFSNPAAAQSSKQTAQAY